MTIELEHAVEICLLLSSCAQVLLHAWGGDAISGRAFSRAVCRACKFIRESPENPSQTTKTNPIKWEKENKTVDMRMLLEKSETRIGV
eukprot:6483250-Amphidinium_carterae.1